MGVNDLSKVNEKPFTRHWLAFVVLLLALCLDGSLSHVLGQWTMMPMNTGVPQLTLLAFVLIGVFVPRESWLLGWSVLFGLIYDSYYTGILGVHAFIFPALVYLMLMIRPYIPRTWPFVLALYVILLTVSGVMNYVFAIFINETTIDVLQMVAQHLGPSFEINLILFAILYYPCSRLLVKLSTD